MTITTTDQVFASGLVETFGRFYLAWLNEIMQRLDEAGYGEIQIVGGFRAPMEMARAMGNMRLKQVRQGLS